jgi:hypothetical protein
VSIGDKLETPVLRCPMCREIRMQIQESDAMVCRNPIELERRARLLAAVDGLPVPIHNNQEPRPNSRSQPSEPRHRVVGDCLDLPPVLEDRVSLDMIC